jgi:hypothetical protein
MALHTFLCNATRKRLAPDCGIIAHALASGATVITPWAADDERFLEA